MTSETASILLLNSVPDLDLHVPNVPICRPSPSDLQDSRRSSFLEFLNRHGGTDTILLGLGRADFLSAGLDARFIRDHINLTGANPLFGVGRLEGIPRFPSQESVWFSPGQAGMETCIAAAAGAMQFVTTAEREFLRRMGADALTADLIQEAILANALGIRSVGLLFGFECDMNLDEMRSLASKVLQRLKKD